MDGQFYIDTRAPHFSTDVTAVTLTSTSKALLTPSYLPVLGGNYFSYVGKAVRLTLFGRITTAATPGNGTFELYWGTGADANGVIIGTSAALTLIASQTNLSWRAELMVRARTLGSAGTLFVTGKVDFNLAVVAAGTIMIPASAPAASAAVDLTAANVISPQFKRSGSTVETMQVHDFLFESLN